MIRPCAEVAVPSVQHSMGTAYHVHVCSELNRAMMICHQQFCCYFCVLDRHQILGPGG